MKQKKFNAILGLSVTLAFTLSACGPQAFVPSAVNSAQSAPGSMAVPPKVDILMGISYAGAMGNIYPQLVQEIPPFVTGLEASGWDYRFVNIPLTQHADITHLHLQTDANGNVITPNVYDAPVSVSHYDSNYASLGLWQAPYPGANSNDPLLGISANLFSQTFSFPSTGTVDSTPNDGHESGFYNQLTYLNRADVHSQLLRPDALLAVITLSNIDDNSGGNWNTVAWNGPTWTSDPTYDATIAPAFINIKGSASLIKYYSLVSSMTTQCLGTSLYSKPGLRYEAMATTLGGKSVDICNNTIPAALGIVAADLQTQTLNFVKSSLVIGTQPDPTTIQVTKYIGGDLSKPVTVPANDPNNGWTYDPNAGVQTVYTVTSPVNMDQATGYVISLHGTSLLTGNDTATVQFLNAGSVSSH